MTDLVERVARAIADVSYDLASPDSFMQQDARAALTAIHEAMTSPTDAERVDLQALCDELDRMGYRPTGWIEPPVLR